MDLLLLVMFLQVKQDSFCLIIQPLELVTTTMLQDTFIRLTDGSPGGAPIIALNETGTSVNDRASVEIPDNGDYRFVFVVGTYDKTGGRKAGADMTIDNIVAEDPYTTGTGAINALLKALHYENTATAASATKKLTATVSTADKSTVLTDDAIINMIGFDLTQETNGPYMIAPTLNLVSTPSDGETQSADILTAKIEKLQARVNASRGRQLPNIMPLQVQWKVRLTCALSLPLQVER